MTGGILEVVAKGTEDIYLTGDPNITFFKTIYRRHTNFSRAELDLHFSNKLDFGKEGYCRLEHYGDLLHRLFLIIKLPKIQIFFRSLTIGEVIALLATYEIVWETDRDPFSKFTELDYNGYCKPVAPDSTICINVIGVKQLIDQKRVTLTRNITITNEFFLRLLTGDFYFQTWKNNNPEFNDTTIIPGTGTTEAGAKYMEDVLYEFFNKDSFNLQYKIIVAQNKDVTNADLNEMPPQQQLPLATSLTIQSEMLNEFIKYAVSDRIYPPTLPTGYNDDNLEFLYNVDTANYTASGSVSQLDSNTVFRSGISTAYGTNTSYVQLDAYKIFDVVLTNNNTNISNASDVQNIKAILLDNIQYGLIKNIKMLINIYDSLHKDSRFIFYRKFPVNTPGSGTYLTNTSFTNQSLIPNPPVNLNDNFTSDFVLAPEVDEPTTITHPMSIFVNTTITNFHNQNRDLFRDSKFTPYFNDIVNLWSRCNVATNVNTPVLSPVPPDNMYYMNYLWFNMNTDIPLSINTYLTTTMPNKAHGLNATTISQLDTYLNSIMNTILAVIKPKITYVDPQIPVPTPTNYDTMQTLNSTVKSITGLPGDIILFCIIRDGLENVLIQVGSSYITIPEYIQYTYAIALNTFAGTLSGSQLTNYNIALTDLVAIIGLYITDYDLIPSYATYVNQKNNIYSDPFKQINSLTLIYSDVQCSIWNYLFLQFIRNYNDMYNQLLLGFTFYTDNIGLELLNYLVDISNDFLLYPITASSYFDYFRNIENYFSQLPINSGTSAYIGQYLDLKILEFQDYLQHYQQNRPLLNMRNIIIPRSLFYFEEFTKIVNFITNIIETTTITNTTTNVTSLLYNHSYHPTSGPPQPFPDIVLETQTTLNDKTSQYLNPRNNAIDIALIMLAVANNFFTDAILPTMALANPYNQATDPHKYDLWQLVTTNPPTTNSTEEIKKFNDPFPYDPTKTLFDWLYRSTSESPSSTDGSQELFKFLLQIDVLYNGFVIESDVYNFMKDYVIQRSILKDIPGLQGPNVQTTNENLIDYYSNQLASDVLLRNRIVGFGNTIGLYNILERSLNNGANAKFSWIQKIGHYIIDQLWIKIDDQIIDKQYGEWLEIWHTLTKKIKKENGYNTLIGNIKELYTYNNKIKEEYEMVIPLQFWFCRHVGVSLPLISLHNADVRLYTKLKKFEDIAFFDSFTTFRNKPKLKCSVLAEYIYVEKEERNKIAMSKLEYLIDVLQFNGDIEITNNSFDDEGYIEAVTRFKNPCKELFWVLQNTSLIDGSLPNGEKLWHVYSYDIDNEINPAKSAKIKFNSRDRETFKEIEYYNNVQPYERHYSDPNVGVNIYCFSLNPESVQPEGSANLSKIDDVSIEMNVKDFVRSDIITANIKFRWAVYALTINVLRICSGLGGLGFQH